MSHHGGGEGHTGKHRVSCETEGKRTVGKKRLSWFHEKEQMRQQKQVQNQLGRIISMCLEHRSYL